MTWSKEAIDAAAAWAHQEQCRRSGTDLPWDVAYESEKADYRNIATQMLAAAVEVDGPVYRKCGHSPLDHHADGKHWGCPGFIEVGEDSTP